MVPVPERLWEVKDVLALSRLLLEDTLTTSYRPPKEKRGHLSLRHSEVGVSRIMSSPRHSLRDSPRLLLSDRLKGHLNVSVPQLFHNIPPI